MKTNKVVSARDRKGEKGAALVMALMVSFLLLVASAGLLLETTTNTMNVTDATAEQQAFNAAESGIQAAVFVLRDNVTLPDSLRIDTSKPATDKANRIDYLKALQPAQSNLTTTGLDAVPRMSRWMNYAGTNRVGMNSSGFSYALEISDPDHTGALVNYYAVGKLTENSGDPTEKLYGDTTNGIRVKYISQPSVQVDTTPGTASANFGSIRITKYGNGAQILNYNRLEIDIFMTVPYAGNRVLRGWIKPNTCSSGVCTTPNIQFDSKTFTLQGSKIVLLTTGGNTVSNTWSPDPVQTGVPSGFSSNLTVPSSSGTPTDSVINGTFSSPEPIRLLVRSTGYGPRGSTKILEAIIRKNFFDGLTAPATLTLIGPASTASCSSCVPAQPSTNFGFALGNSNAMLYSGQDAVSTDIIPPIGASGDINVSTILDEIDDVNRSNRITGTPSDISADTPAWLSTPTNLDTAVKALQVTADSSSRYFANGVAPSASGGQGAFGNPNGTGITFCDGDCTFTGDGGGILVVTGKLTLHGAFSFKGLIIVTGQGGVDRQGAGNGTIEGNMVIAPYVNSRVLPASEPAGIGFLAPQYDLSGGGASTIQYNSTALSNGLVAVNNFVLGVVEK